MASPFKRLNFESLQKDPEWQQYKYYINKKNINLLNIIVFKYVFIFRFFIVKIIE